MKSSNIVFYHLSGYPQTLYPISLWVRWPGSSLLRCSALSQRTHPPSSTSSALCSQGLSGWLKKALFLLLFAELAVCVLSYSSFKPSMRTAILFETSFLFPSREWGGWCSGGDGWGTGDGFLFPLLWWRKDLFLLSHKFCSFFFLCSFQVAVWNSRLEITPYGSWRTDFTVFWSLLLGSRPVPSDSSFCDGVGLFVCFNMAELVFFSLVFRYFKIRTVDVALSKDSMCV